MHVPYTHHISPAEMAHVTTAVRQGVALGVMRWVVVVSLACAVAGLVVARLLA